ncbi:hypothetical protein NW752_009582 [Fusarium irregulare]|nr:hypothetical protein NW752_009582 [Fusarium irregulare]
MFSSNTNDRRFNTFQKRLVVIENRFSQQSQESQESQGSQTFKLPLKLGVEELLVDFLKGFIEFMPLYTEKVGWDMINGWQCDLNEPDDCTWGAINVLLALALRHRPGGAEGREKLALECIENAQSVSHTFIRNLDFEELRAALGLAILLMNTDEPARASVPVGIAVALCRQMNLHLNYEDNDRFWERKQLFRVTYILDRDLAFRTKQPYLLQDEDIELRIPESHLCDLLGTSDVALPLHIFNLRIQLVEIQGLAYDLISP